MRRPEASQPEQAAQLQSRPGAPDPRPIDEQEQTGPEQHGEQPAHLAIDQDELRQPTPLVRRPMGHQERARIEAGGEWLAERRDVGEQDADHGHAANEVERRDPLARHGGRRRWLRGGCAPYSLRQALEPLFP